jgi:hypothetical protein
MSSRTYINMITYQILAVQIGSLVRVFFSVALHLRSADHPL